jgi:hypothetical protein
MRYESETYRRKEMKGEGYEYEKWRKQAVGYWRCGEVEDVELAVAAQKGFINGVLGKGRLHPVEGMFFRRMGGS